MRAYPLFVGVLAAGLSAVQAADLTSGAPSDRGLYYSATGQRIDPVIVWDYEPGVSTRAYWEQPWRNRHYFPETGHKPRSGRHENLRAPRLAAVPAEPYYRGWTNAEPPPLPALERPLK